MKRPGARLVIGALTLAVLAVSVPGALREAREHGSFYLLSVRFFEDIPKRLLGSGRFRFIFQPAIAILIGWRAGRADARAGRPPYLRGLLFHAEHRAAMARETVEGIAVLFLMGILLDSSSGCSSASRFRAPRSSSAPSSSRFLTRPPGRSQAPCAGRDDVSERNQVGEAF